MRTLQCIAQSDIDALKEKYREPITSLRDIQRRFSKHDAERNRKLTESLTALHDDAERGEFAILVGIHNFGFEIREAYIYVQTGHNQDCLRYSHLGPAKQDALNRLTEEQRSALLADKSFNIDDCKVSQLRERVDSIRGKIKQPNLSAPPAQTPPLAEATAPSESNDQRDWALGRLQYDHNEKPTAAEIHDRYVTLRNVLPEQFEPGLQLAAQILNAAPACNSLAA